MQKKPNHKKKKIQFSKAKENNKIKSAFKYLSIFHQHLKLSYNNWFIIALVPPSFTQLNPSHVSHNHSHNQLICFPESTEPVFKRFCTIRHKFSSILSNQDSIYVNLRVWIICTHFLFFTCTLLRSATSVCLHTAFHDECNHRALHKYSMSISLLCIRLLSSAKALTFKWDLTFDYWIR